MNLNIQNCKQFSQNVVPNTFIGGIAKQGGEGVNAPIDTVWKLSQKIGVSVNRISGFRVIGNDVECRIKGNYNLANTFGSGSSVNSNQNITNYVDSENLIIEIGNSSFSFCLNFEYLKADGMISFGSGGTHRFYNTKIKNLEFLNFINGQFGNKCMMNMPFLENVIMSNARESANYGGNNILDNCPSLLLVDFRSMRFLGRKYVISTLNRGFIFNNSGSSNTLLKVHQDVQFVDVDGGLDVNVAYAKNVRGWTIELYDDNGNYVSTL